MDNAISVDGLYKKYKNGRGIENISFTVNEGDIFGFLGPNGAGKTTAMKVMTGLSRADAGDVYIEGHSISESYESAMKHVGCIIENVTPYPYLTAYENMKLHGRFYEVDDARIDECLELAGILPFKNERTKNYSLGMRQRLGIALAILPRPHVLILDEPLNGLDVEGMVDIRRLIQRLADEDKTTFLISSHLIHDVELTCTKIGILYEGKMVNVDTTENILQNYSSLENYYLSEVGANGQA